MTLKTLDELERLIVEELRLQLALCDRYEETLTTDEGKRHTDRMRNLARMKAEIWFELIPLMRDRHRAKRLSRAARQRTVSQIDRKIDKMHRKWALRLSQEG